MESFVALARTALPYLLMGAEVSMRLIATVLVAATLLALPIAVARDARWRWVSLPVGLASWALRGLPPIVVLFFVYFVAPQWGMTLDPFPAAVIGMTAYTAFQFAEAVRAGLQAVDAGQHVAIRALAMRPLRGFVRIVLPQALPAMIPPYVNYATELVKDSALASAIAVPEMMGNASQLITSVGEPFQILLMVGAIYAALDGALLVVQGSAERRFATRSRG
jgi:His/Glu/Gln/Arg/opine family amino acid ABC transporter permease subunit